MSRKRYKPTIHDVALTAGVSISSVSRVLNNIEPISESLRQRVEQAMQQVGYHHARKKRKYDFPMIYVLIPDTNNLYFMEIINGIEDEARRVGYLVSILTVTQDPGHKEKIIHWLIKSHCAGIIFCSSSGCFTDADLIYLKEEQHIPIVLLNRRLPSKDFAGIQINFVDAMYRATKHLLELGHIRFGLLGRPEISESANKKKEEC